MQIVMGIGMRLDTVIPYFIKRAILYRHMEVNITCFFTVFYKTVLEDMERYKDMAGVIKVRSGLPENFYPVSCFPLETFAGFSHDTYTEISFLFPSVTFGKYFSMDNKILLPASVFVSRAVADGYRTCKLIDDIQEMASHPALLFRIY